MSLLSKLMDTMRLGPEEDEDGYYLDEDFDEEEPPRKPLFGGKKNSGDYEEEEEPEKPRFLGRSNPRLCP